ncbi:MAG: UDP-N-acetylmuramoyl-L-alanyl-D-glutamate--2,6-diaminopimelate ligase [Clostridiales Family XIII bacterium]|jgi:UDP-N-acetylmuramoyl-L-alanyl-D-glutamate--2,6-diaminopimelate ligase|nr:UDP-N-acetylmuramoyl-L-alanyl-D-glutamate--2,6-diaminopimelate ligase [Clostridiales Family XIII bacterium]
MKLKELFDGVEHDRIQGDPDTDVTGVCVDGRLAEKGDLFVALTGARADGHDHIDQAAARGAAAALIRNADPSVVSRAAALDIAVLRVPDTREILSELVNRFYGYPGRAFRLIGITGTNGKTSTAVTLDHILRSVGHRTGLLGTIENRCCGETLPVRRTTPTTPDCVELGALMSRMAKAGIDDLIMEVSSMGLKTGRVNALTFDVGVFTNISPEHLDDHGTMEDYRASKLKLFSLSDRAVINMDDPFSRAVAGRARGETLGFGIESGSAGAPFRETLCAKDLIYSPDGVTFGMAYRSVSASGKAASDLSAAVTLGTPSRFAVYNALAAVGAALSLGVGFSSAAASLADRIDIPGRFEVIRSAGGLSAVVDYAHTTEALENLLTAVRANPRCDRIVSVFGCGGDRDPGKRAPMGEVSGRLADYTIVTSDNPRTEDPLAIIDGVVDGLRAGGGAYTVEPDRAKAIEKAVSEARPGTVIVVAGKGHEDYQIVGCAKIPFDDRAAVRAAFARSDASRGGRGAEQ